MCELFLRYSDDAVPKFLLSTELQVVLRSQIFFKLFSNFMPHYTTNISNTLYTSMVSFRCQKSTPFVTLIFCGKCVPLISIFIDNFDILSIEMPLFLFAQKGPFPEHHDFCFVRIYVEKKI